MLMFAIGMDMPIVFLVITRWFYNLNCSNNDAKYTLS